MADHKLLSARQISEHKTPEDCWIVVDKQVWDVTDFLEEHPGGSASTYTNERNIIGRYLIFYANSYPEICRQ